MKPPNEAWEPWVYRGAMMLIGATNIGGALWAHGDLAYGDWPASTATVRLQYIFWLGMAAYALMGLHLYGLVSRNLVRAKIRAKLMGAELDVE